MQLTDFTVDLPGGLTIAGFEVGAGKPLVCVHGLSRNAYDFERLALALAGEDRRVIAYDVAGRGKSGWLPQAALYDYPNYLAQAAGFLQARGLSQVDWLGTSMGGIIGMALAAHVSGSIGRLILNDVGAFIPKESLLGIWGADAAPIFADLKEAEAHLRARHADFGPIDDAGWARMAETSVRGLPDGTLTLHFDPNIYGAFTGKPPVDANLWDMWSKVTVPTLVLRGQKSALLPKATALGMVASRPGVSLVEIQDCGHAPSLMQADQIKLVGDWLNPSVTG